MYIAREHKILVSQANGETHLENQLGLRCKSSPGAAKEAPAPISSTDGQRISICNL